MHFWRLVMRNALAFTNAFGRKVGVPSFWPRPGGVGHKHGMGVIQPFAAKRTSRSHFAGWDQPNPLTCAPAVWAEKLAFLEQPG